MPRTTMQPRRDHQQTVLAILKDLKGLEPLKQLFWSELNYTRVNQSLPRRGWTETAAKALAEDPILFAAAGADNGFHVIYTRLASDRLLLGQERPVVSRLLREHPYALFIFSNSAHSHWHFLNVKHDEDIQKRQLFRRFTVGPEERLRTTSERLAMLDLASISPDLFGLSPLAVQERNDEAFDVEAVQKDFFKVFADLYHKVVEDIAQVSGMKSEAGKLAQLLLDRMLFLYFIQKKGWLDGKQNYLFSRFQECWKEDPKGHSYYSSVLYPLFLCLSKPETEYEHVGIVPFLNGGLFEEDAKQSQAERIAQARLQVRNLTFKTMFDDLLEKFNFTVTEDTPLDVEVAIDPEMLGKIFESLILQLEKDPAKDLRKLTGSYYTPRPIVHFMCQEALKEYLVTELAGDDSKKIETYREKAERFLALPPADHFDEEQVKALEELFTAAEAKMLRQAILDCRICDPAVGSGAFPVGMLHEMISATARLDLRVKGPEVLKRRNYDYDLKKQIVESCLYGVDIQEQAVRLCELRLWLSLVVDYQIDPKKSFAQAIREIPSLPNLSYRIVRGDSLLERLFGHIVQLDEMAKDERTQQLIESIQADKQAYFREDDTIEKRRLELKILSKQTELAERLIETKRDSLKTYQLSLFGEEEMDPKAKKAKAEREAQVRELDELKDKVHRAKAELERLSRQKQFLARGDIDTLRRQYFHTGDAPTFIWHVDFAEVFTKKNGFDIVIANPPYVRVQQLSHSIIDELKSFFPTLVKRIDLSIAFIEKSITALVRQNGICVFITSLMFARAEYGERIRPFLIKHGLLGLIDFKDTQIFEEALNYTGILFFTKSKAPTTPWYIDASSYNRVKVTALSPHMRSNFLISKTGKWTLGEATTSNFIQKLRERFPLTLNDGIADVEYGIITGRDDVFILSGLLSSPFKESKLLIPIIFPQDTKRYSLTTPEQYVIYPYRLVKDRTIVMTETEFRKNYDAIYLYLRSYRQVLEGRKDSRRMITETGKPWYALVRHSNWATISSPKIVTQSVATRPEFSLDSSGYAFAGGKVYAIVPRRIDPHSLLGILNSRLIGYYLKLVCPPKAGGYYSCAGEYLKSIPIPEFNGSDASLKLIAKLAQETMANTSNSARLSIADLGKRIDEEVFKLYCLDNNEIKLVLDQD